MSLIVTVSILVGNKTVAGPMTFPACPMPGDFVEAGDGIYQVNYRVFQEHNPQIVGLVCERKQ